jgi:hypothetical protein
MPRLSSFTPDVIPKEFLQQLVSLKIKSVEDLISTPVQEILNKTKINEKVIKKDFKTKGIQGNKKENPHFFFRKGCFRR